MPNLKPVLILIAGANGCGKTTITKNLLANPWTLGCEYINPDDLAKAMPGGWDAKENFVEAQKQASERCEQNLRDGRSMVLETAFSSQRKLNFVAEAKKAGFFIRLYFIGTASPDINAARICRRMMTKTGHEVLIRDIIKRHDGAINMCVEASPMVDRLYVFDNTTEGLSHQQMFRVRDGYLHKVYKPVLDFVWATNMLKRVADRLEEGQAAVNEEMTSTDASEA